MAIFNKAKDEEEKQVEVDTPEEKPADDKKPDSSIDWFDNNQEVGELSVDVYEKNNQIVIKSTLAGVMPEDIEVTVDDEVVTIRGKRQQEETIDKKNFFYQECYWGGFERILKLPVAVQEDGAEASLRNGVLTVKLQKIKKPKSIVVPVK